VMGLGGPFLAFVVLFLCRLGCFASAFHVLWCRVSWWVGATFVFCCLCVLFECVFPSRVCKDDRKGHRILLHQF
jgi:hypothetical protein